MSLLKYLNSVSVCSKYDFTQIQRPRYGGRLLRCWAGRTMSSKPNWATYTEPRKRTTKNYLNYRYLNWLICICVCVLYMNLAVLNKLLTRTNFEQYSKNWRISLFSFCLVLPNCQLCPDPHTGRGTDSLVKACTH